MPRPIQCLVDIRAMSANLQRVKTLAPNASTWAVVKANAYGHSIEAAVKGFGEADGLAMLDFLEARRARAAGWAKPILMMEGAFDDADIADAVELGLDLSVHDELGLKRLQGNAHRLKVNPIRVWLKINTGMNRLGFAPSNAAFVLAQLAALRAEGALSELGLMTHFARADDEQGITAQLGVWQDMLKGLTLGELGVKHVSLCNSAASLKWFSETGAHEGMRLWVRPGVALYGGTPFSGASSEFPNAAQLGLAPVQTLRSEIIAVREVRAGDEVGYGGNYVANKPRRIGVVACGYADGYPRIARNGTPVLVDGLKTSIVGRVSMDMITVDLTDLPQAKEGSSVELWGPNLAIDEVASFANTIGYELMCAVAPRVPMVVKNG